eukprot:COSAG02_NODE_31395_length_534_cov_0.921839_1_plen_29_part_10
MWWDDPATSDKQRSEFRRLLATGQVEFVN